MRWLPPPPPRLPPTHTPFGRSRQAGPPRNPRLCRRRRRSRRRSRRCRSPRRAARTSSTAPRCRRCWRSSPTWPPQTLVRALDLGAARRSGAPRCACRLGAARGAQQHQPPLARGRPCGHAARVCEPCIRSAGRGRSPAAGRVRCTSKHAPPLCVCVRVCADAKALVLSSWGRLLRLVQDALQVRPACRSRRSCNKPSPRWCSASRKGPVAKWRACACGVTARASDLGTSAEPESTYRACDTACRECPTTLRPLVVTRVRTLPPPLPLSTRSRRPTACSLPASRRASRASAPRRCSASTPTPSAR